MVLTRAVSNLAKRISSENTPPKSVSSTKSFSARLRNTITEAAKRRRARAAGGAHNPRHAVEQAKRRSEAKSNASVRFQVPVLPHISPEAGPSKDAEMKDAEPVSTPNPPTTVNLPRYLARPEYKPVPKENLAAVEPELECADMDYIRDELKAFGPGMLAVLSGVQADPITNALPKELSILINDVSSDVPTHMLAVYSRQTSAANRRRVTLFPTHSVVLASYCANLPKLPAPHTVDFPCASGSRITIPVVPLCLPSPTTFPQLSSYLYTKQTSHLLNSLLPCPAPSSLDPATFKSDDPALTQFARNLAGTFTAQALFHQAMVVNALWRNVCALGIFDDDLWNTMDLAWEVLLTGMAISTGNLSSMSSSIST